MLQEAGRIVNETRQIFISGAFSRKSGESASVAKYSRSQ
jgi:hypothetical protein